MLNSVLKDAIKKRDETLSILKGPKFEQIVKEAKSNWIDFSPTKQDVVAVGIDSSFNSTKFQGAELWAVTAVSVKSDGEILVDLHEHGLDSNPELASLASKMEIDACQESVDKADLVLMDGSLYSQFLTRQKPLANSLVNTITKKNNVIFISKTSNTKKHFEINEPKYNLKKVGFTDKVLSKKEMIGNRFQIKIDGASNDLSEFTEFDKILNFYGYQRFGSRRPVTHLIGRSLIQKDFAGAVDLLLSFTSEYDKAENTKLRELMNDKSKYSEALQILPKGMDLEKIALKEMIEHDDPVKTLRALPLSIRRFFVQAYQSYIFNQTLSMSLDAGEELFSPQSNDVCYDKHGELGKFENDPSQRLSIPFVGYSYYKKTRFNYYIEKILCDEGITHKDFFSKEIQEISSEGGFRNSSIKCDDYEVKDNIVSFSLSRGSFATIVLREIIKPENPLISGF